MSNITMMAEPIRMMGKVLVPAAGARVAMIDPDDVAASAVSVLSGDIGDGRTHELTGPDAITFERVAEELSNATGREIEFLAPPEDMARAGMIAGGLPEWLADNLLVMYRLLNEGAASQVTTTVRELTGSDPKPFSVFARKHASEFGSRS